MTMLTRQEIFNKVARHLLRQGKRSISVDGSSCAYRGKRGLKCAVGCLLPDDFYRPDMEGKTVSSLFDIYGVAMRRAGLSLKLGGFLFDLQLIHDLEHPRRWAPALRDLAKRNGLTFPRIYQRKKVKA